MIATLRIPRITTGALVVLILAVCLTVSAASAIASSPARHAASRDQVSASAARVVPRSLRAAAARTTRADHAVVKQARSLKACLRSHEQRPVLCQADRHALQRAGVALAAARRALAAIATSGGSSIPAAAASRTLASSLRVAPRLFVAGDTLRWTPVGRMRTYVMAREVTGQPNEYSLVTGTAITPPPVPGASVRYTVRTTAPHAAWAAAQTIAYPSPTPPPTPTTQAQASASPPAPGSALSDLQAAPHLTVSGQTLTWSAVANVGTYVLVSTVAGQPAKYTVVSGTSATPAPVPGTTVHFSIRTAVDGSVWAPEVAISYPPAPQPAPPTPPVHEAPAPTTGNATFQPGLNSGSSTAFDIPGSVQLGAKVVRMQWNIEASPQELEPVIAEYAAEGIRVAPLAVFDGRIPSGPEAQNLASWARAFGPGGTFWATRSDGQLAIQTIEFGNETSYSYQYPDDSPTGYATRAQGYATSFAEAAQAIKAVNPGVGLLAQGDAGNAGPIWIENMFKAVPDLGQLVAGWTIHPYGPGWRPRLEALVKETAAQGAPATIPIDITEWGLSTDNGHCVTENYGWNTCMSYQEAGEVLTRSVSEMRQTLDGRLGLFLLYDVRDQQAEGSSNNRESYFGALQHETQSKGAYTEAVKALMSS
jgi:hypothetical protein